MGVTRCGAGHYYDEEKFSTCPHCGVALHEGDEEKTVAKRHKQSVDDEITLARLVHGAKGEKTIGIARVSERSMPVTGWLVCVAGSEKGRDYRLHAGRNFIGRTMGSDVPICDDAQISRENHCSIVFDPITAAFTICVGEGIAYVGTAILREPRLLADGEILELGSTSLMLATFCRKGKTWEKDL